MEKGPHQEINLLITDEVPVGHCAAPHDKSRDDVGSVVLSKQQEVVRKVWGELVGHFYMLYPGDFLGAEGCKLSHSCSWN